MLLNYPENQIWLKLQKIPILDHTSRDSWEGSLGPEPS